MMLCFNWISLWRQRIRIITLIDVSQPQIQHSACLDLNFAALYHLKRFPRRWPRPNKVVRRRQRGRWGSDHARQPNCLEQHVGRGLQSELSLEGAIQHTQWFWLWVSGGTQRLWPWAYCRWTSSGSSASSRRLCLCLLHHRIITQQRQTSRVQLTTHTVHGCISCSNHGSNRFGKRFKVAVWVWSSVLQESGTETGSGTRLLSFSGWLAFNLSLTLLHAVICIK